MPRPDAINTRLVLRIDALVTAAIGAWLIWWAHFWVGRFMVFPVTTFVRTLGGLVIAAAVLVAALGGETDPARRKRGLAWLVAAHATVVIVLITGRITGWGIGQAADQVAAVVAAMGFGLLYVLLTAEGEIGRTTRSLISLFGGRREPSTETLRSRYEQQIREAARQEERNRLARDLHDSVKQQIFAIHTAAATAQARLDGDPPGVRDALDQVRASSREAMAEMEAMLDQLRAVPLDRTGLVEAVSRQCEALRFRSGADVRFTHGELPPPEACDPGTYQTLFRVAQEALSNVGRHARAAQVAVSLTASLGHLVLTVQDDGEGMASVETSSGMGVANMRARAEEVGGTFSVTSRAEGGTVVRCDVPYAYQTPGDRAVVRRRVLTHGTAFLLAFLFNVPFMSRSPAAPSIAVITGIGVIRGVVAYWRLTRQAEAQR